MQNKASGKRFTLRALLVLVTILCAVLALWYPRARYAVTVNVPRPPGPASLPRIPNTLGIDIFVYNKLIGMPEMIDLVKSNSPSAAAYLKNVPDESQFLRSLITVTAAGDWGDETVQFKATGRPTERRKIKIMVDAVADAFVEHHNQRKADQAHDFRYKLEKARAEIQANVATSSGKERERSTILLKAIDDRINELETIDDAVRPAEITHRESGLAF